MSKYLNWKKPHLKEDVLKWIALTCVLRMEWDGVTLPDDDWIWIDEWKVDIQGNYWFTTNADGWEYETYFKRFNRSKIFIAGKGGFVLESREFSSSNLMFYCWTKSTKVSRTLGL